ncbi:MAG: hypothetical protein KBT22_06950 [Bacteroidales bacterium]|nr:hypothetical protein [Candidatus Scybalocola fimicaballi]
MKNIYFPDEDITFNDLYFVCYMIERVARNIKQRNRYVVEHIGSDGLARQLSIAETNHCLNPEQVVSDWKNEYNLDNGDVDITKIDSEFTDKFPSETQMGKVYARLIDSVSKQGQDLVQTIQNVYASPICDAIDNYNSSAYYEPSYIQTRAYYDGSF